IARYGSDKPDLRFGLELHDLTDVFRESEFNAFRQAIEGGSVVRGLNAGSSEMSRSDLDGLVAEAAALGGKGPVWEGGGGGGVRRSPSSSGLRRSGPPTMSWARARGMWCSSWRTSLPCRRKCSASCGDAWASGSA